MFCIDRRFENIITLIDGSELKSLGPRTSVPNSNCPASFCESGLPLFDHARIEIEPQKGNLVKCDDTRESIRHELKRKFDFINQNLYEKINKSRPLFRSRDNNIQYELIFVKNVFKLVTRDHRVILNQEIGSFFCYCRDHALENASIDMYHDGIRQVGDLVQMPKSEIMPYLRNEKKYYDRLQKHLRGFGLDTGTPIPWWTPTPV